MLKIGILITRLKAEKDKNELLNINSTKRPWLKKTPHHLTIIHKGKRCTSGDVSIGMYIGDKFGIDIDFISPEEISVKRCHSNDINFMLIFDLIECYHVDYKKKGNKALFDNFKKTLQRVRNMYPPYYYQKFINNKCSYISHLDKKLTPTIPTFCITQKNYFKNGIKDTMEKLQKKIKSQKWTKIIGKPIYGQEAIDFKIFNPNDNGNKALVKYMDRCFNKYPGIIFQKYIEGFDKEIPEIRLYFIGGKYEYSVITTSKSIKLPKDEGGTGIIQNKNEIITKGYDIIKDLPEIKMNGIVLPNLLTRLDIGCLQDNSIFVNEVEFVPSLYVDVIKVLPEPMLGDEMVNILKRFKKIDSL